MRPVASPASNPQPPPRSRWHDWWKLPLFFGVVGGALALAGYLNDKGWVLLLLLLAYLLFRVVRGVGALIRKR